MTESRSSLKSFCLRRPTFKPGLRNVTILMSNTEKVLRRYVFDIYTVKLKNIDSSIQNVMLTKGRAYSRKKTSWKVFR